MVGLTFFRSLYQYFFKPKVVFTRRKGRTKMDDNLQMVRRFSINETGRDFVVGDIHGCYSLLEQALACIDFNPGKDRLFSVGDLIDRGPESLRCLEFLQQPFFHPVMGNHEDMLLDMYVDGTPDLSYIAEWAKQNGVEWWYDISDDDRYRVLDKICALPFAIEVETPNGLVGIIHAEVPLGMDWQEFTNALRAEKTKTVQTCLWGRYRANKQDRTGVEGIARIYAGHTPQDCVTPLGNLFVIDTGAVFGVNCAYGDGHLSLVQINAAQPTAHTDPIQQQPYIKVFQ